MRTQASALIGRGAQTRIIDDLLTAARAGRGGAMFLTGEPGIGKTRLAMAAADRGYAGGMRLMRGRGSSLGPTVPFRPLAEALLSLARAEHPPGGAALLPYRRVLGRLVPEWAESEAPAEGGSVVVLAEAVLRVAAAVGRERGCLLLLDDLHDADAETLAVVEYLADNLREQPVLLIATVRGEPSPAAQLVRALTRRRTGTELVLDRLSAPDVRRMVASCLDATVDELPTGLTELLFAESAGNPYVVEELLDSMLQSGHLGRGPEGWALDERRRGGPESVLRGVLRRAGTLGPEGLRAVSMAALLGQRFPVAVLQRATGLPDRTLLSYLQAGHTLRLVEPDEHRPDWYAFRHPLTVEALRDQLSPADRVALARLAATAVEQEYPGLPGEWCQLAAVLRLAAADHGRAAQLYAEAGRRALADGAAASAVSLLTRARQLLSESPGLAAASDPAAGTGPAGLAEPGGSGESGGAGSPGPVGVEVGAEVLQTLLQAYAEAGRYDEAVVCAGSLDGLGGHGLGTARRAALHTRLAWAATVAGRWSDGMAQVAAARTLLGPDGDPGELAAVDAVDAYLALELPGQDRMARAERLARRAAEVADRVPLPVVACQAWQMLGVLARYADPAESERCFERVARLAERYELPVWRIHALIRLGGSDALETGDLTRLRRGYAEAQRVGALAAGYATAAILGLQEMLRGNVAAATTLVDDCVAGAGRMGLIDSVQYALLTRAVIAAHQGQRRAMDQALAAFRAQDGDGSALSGLAHGLARAVCALLEEDRDRAARDFGQLLAVEHANPTRFHLAGQFGLCVLLNALAGRWDEERHRMVAAERGAQLRWNASFVLLAEAVLAGRSGDGERASRLVEQAGQVAVIYPLAHHLGLRLVAEAALDDGWGQPVVWLNEAEGYCHEHGLHAMAAACRALLRRVGVTVPQRRAGVARIPANLRALGITLREYEVLELVGARLGNRAIAGRLHISPRTVEKHVASLLAKTGAPDRHQLGERLSQPV